MQLDSGVVFVSLKSVGKPGQLICHLFSMGNKQRIKASVFILTKNSAATIARALESVRQFEDIVVCDGGSNDDTLKIARSFGARVFQQDRRCLDKEGRIADYACVRNDCLDHTRYDWVLYIDSDERVSPRLVEQIGRIVSQGNKKAVYRVPCRIYAGKKEVRYSSNYPGYQYRFFNKRSEARFVKPVHERIEFSKKGINIYTLDGAWEYFIEADGSDFAAAMPRYIKLEADRFAAKNFLEKGKGIIAALRTALAVLLKSILNYLRYGFKDTMPFKIELLRIKYQLKLIWAIIKAK